MPRFIDILYVYGSKTGKWLDDEVHSKLINIDDIKGMETIHQSDVERRLGTLPSKNEDPDTEYWTVIHCTGVVLYARHTVDDILKAIKFLLDNPSQVSIEVGV